MALGYQVAFATFASAALGAAAPAPVEGQTKPKLLNLAEVLTVADYPREALLKGEQGTAQIVLTLASDGRVKDCKVETSSGSSILDTTSCRLYKERARFEAVPEEAKPRTFSEKVTWSVGEMPRSRRGWFERSIIEIKADGSVMSCRRESSDGPDTDCQIPDRFPAQFAAGAVQNAGSDPARLIFEGRFYPDREVPSKQMIPHLIMQRAARVVVKNDGTLRSCEVIEPGPSEESRASVCREVGQYHFEQVANAPDATGIIRLQMYVEPKATQ